MQKIIITQDIKALLDQKDHFLNRADVKIFSAASNEEALEIHRAEKADIIIADLDADILKGELFCSTIREDEELCRVSLIITYSGNPNIQRISSCRANAFIKKSADPALLIEKARQLMSIPVREAYRTPIGITVNCDSTGGPSLGYSENISVTGMLIDTEKTFSKGEILLCSFVLPDSTHVRTKAEIVRISARATEHDANQYGIRFLDLDAACRTAIADYVRKRNRRR
jgi:DNA-binding response OmpR family regulator